MKKLLLAIGLCGLAPLISNAQNSELGLSGGFGTYGAPGGNAFFKADQGGNMTFLAMTYVSNLNRYSESKLTWQLGFEAIATNALKHNSNDTFNYFTKTIGGTDGRPFRYANTLLTFSPLVNMKYKISDITYVYGGLAFGAAGTRNVSNVKPQDFEGDEVSYKAPDGGMGFIGGIHAGVTRRVTQRIAVNAQIGFKYYSITFKADDINYPGGNVFNYTNTMIPIMIGIRYRMGWLKEYNSATGRYMIIKEELESKKDSGE